jgi:Tfp pilus assembly pilus retraction ATPase PilT
MKKRKKLNLQHKYSMIGDWRMNGTTIKKLSELLVSDNLSDIHLHMTPGAGASGGSRVAAARARIAGDLSKEELFEIDIPEILFPQQNGITLTTAHGKSFRLRTTPSKNSDEKLLFVRVLPICPPPIEAVGAKQFFENIYDRDSLASGLILAAGRAGSGKSTFIASVLQHCVSSYPIHIVSLEDPIEYVLTPGKGYATQTNISFDSRSFKDSLRGCMREDPDILFIGEVRDRETAETALLAAESGHLVFGTVHAGSSAGIADRLMGLMEGTNPDYTAQQISQCLRTCLNIERSGMVFKYTFTKIDDALRTIIRDRKLHLWDQYAVPEIVKRGGQ